MDKQLPARVALFIIYSWFGFLKILGLSPADPLVNHLLNKTLTFISFPTFVIILGSFETLLGILFLFKRLDKLSATLFLLHMIAVFSALILIPEISWHGFLIPTIEGQYIIKNVALIALVLSLRPRPSGHVEPS